MFTLSKGILAFEQAEIDTTVYPGKSNFLKRIDKTIKLKNMKKKIIFLKALTVLVWAGCFHKSFGQIAATNEKLEALSPKGNTATWANRTIFTVVFDIMDVRNDFILSDTNIVDFRNIRLPDKQYKIGKRLVDYIIDGVFEGKIKAYKDETGELLSLAEVKSIGAKIDTMQVQDPQTLEWRQVVIEYKLDKKSIRSYKVMLDWFYDAATNKMETKVVGIAPMEKTFKENGDYDKQKILFWVYFN